MKMTMKTKVSLSQQIEEVEYELELRKGLYPRWVATRRLTQKDADFHILRLENVRDTLIWLRENEAKIKACLT